jgi:hypothetical protein
LSKSTLALIRAVAQLWIVRQREFTTHFMSTKKYANYTAQIYQDDDIPSAAAKGEAMKAAFPGADYELLDGDPCGQCSTVGGRDAKIRAQIKQWINSR